MDRRQGRVRLGVPAGTSRVFRRFAEFVHGPGAEAYCWSNELRQLCLACLVDELGKAAYGVEDLGCQVCIVDG